MLDKASQYITGVAWHCYESPNWRVLTDFHNRHPNVKQYMTECWTPSRENYSWRQAADFTMGPLQNWASGVMAWGLGTDNGNGPYLSGGHSCKECRGLVTIDAVSGSYQLQIDYYMMAQFSKFMPKGAKVLSGTGSYSFADGSGIESVASLNPDGSRTVVIENKFGNDVYATLTTKSGETWSGWTRTNSVVSWVLPPAASW